MFRGRKASPASWRSSDNFNLIKLLELSELDRQRWEELLSVAPAATFFHTAEWAQLWEESYSFFKSYFLVDIASDGSYRAGLPFVKAKKLLTGYYSMPMGSYGGAVGREAFAETALYHRWLEVTKSIKRERLVLTSPTEIPALADLGFRVKRSSAQVAEGVNSGRLEAAWSAKTKNEIRYALTSGLNVELVQDAKGARRCFELAGKKHPKSFYTAEFYRTMLEILLPTGRLFWPIVCQNGEPVGFQIYFPFKKEWFYWGAAYEPRFSRTRPGYFLFYHALQQAKEKGAERLNFGATPPGASGVRFFKSRLGGKDQPVYEYAFGSAVRKKLRAAYEKIRGRV